MQIKLVVAQRVEGLTQTGETRTNIGMITAQSQNGDAQVKLEIVGLLPEHAKNFPVGRLLEITIPTYQKEPRIVTMGATGIG